MSIRLYIGNLPKEVDRQELQDIFATGGEPSVTAKLITDRKTGKCRGFGFVTVPTDEQADQFIEKFNGYMFKETALKIEKALPKTKGKEDKLDQPEKPEKPEKVEKAEKSESGGVKVITTPGSSGSSGGSGGSGGSGKSKSNRRRGDKRRNNEGQTTTTQIDPGSIQPDPRWANKLAELKQMFAAQAN